MPTRRVNIVPHTHWDREWYAPFQTFRMRLVDLLDGLLDDLEADPGYRHFLLDGQMAMIDDYLAVRPEAEDRLRRLAVAGRVAVGPWYVLADEFLVSGETIVRDLELGLRRAAAFGGGMEIGYLPDMFGHIAQMPQILRQFGFADAVVWRGVPSSVDRSAFWWESPDGSRVRAEYLLDGYGNGARMPRTGAELVGQVAAWENDFSALLGDAPILWMNGTDHLVPQPWLPRVVEEAAGLAPERFDLAVVSLAEHLDGAPTQDLPTHRGELRSGARANLLMGVVSNRVDVRRAAAAAERSLEKLAEPLCALFLAPGDWPGPLLDAAWLEVIRNAAHDSICACSHDDVVAAVLHRYAEATAVAEGLTRRALRAIGRSVDVRGPVIVNPSPRPRSGVVELVLAGEDAPDSVQVLERFPSRLATEALPAAEALLALERAFDLRPGLGLVSVGPREDGILDVVVDASGPAGSVTDRRSALAEIRSAVAGGHERVRVITRQAPSLTVLARADSVPPYGWAAYRPAPLDVAPVRADGLTMSNGLVTVTVDPADATFAIDGHGGLGRLIDGGDVGDTYNYCPPSSDVLVVRPVAVRVSTEHTEAGPLVARVRLVATYRWPLRADDYSGERVDGRDVAVTTAVELRAGESFARVSVTFDNVCEDHRLRAHFPLPRPAACSRAECAFTVTERGLYAEGGPTELGLATFPSRRFVQAGGLTVAHEGLCEYELVEIADGAAHELAVTLLRATGWLSRGPMPTRPLPAGPELALRGSQCRGPHEMRYVVALGEIDGDVLADEAFTPLLVARAGGTGNGPLSGSALRVEGAPVSAVRRVEGGLEVRVFNPSPDPAVVHLPGRAGWLVDLRGRPLRRFDERFALDPHQIATARLT